MHQLNENSGNVEGVTLEAISRQNKLLHGLKHVQDRFYLSKNTKELFEELLQHTLEATDSPEGCIAELVTSGNEPYLNILAKTGNADESLRARLTAHLLQKDDVLIFNAPAGKDSVLRSFIGLPARLDDNLIGIVCLANREGGYDKEQINLLEPMRTTFNSLLIFSRLREEKVKAEERQQELNKHLHSLLESVDDIVFELNGNMKFLNVWVRDEAMLFMPKERFLGKTIAEVMGPLAENLQAFIREVINTGEAGMVEYSHINPEEDLTFRARASVISKHDDPQHTKIALVIQDITEQRKQEEEHIKARSTAEEIAKAKGNFLSVMSHEIRTPLNGIIGISNLLGQNHTEEQKGLVDNLIFSSNHLLQLVNDILDLSKIENDNLELVTGPVRLRQLVNNISNQFAAMATAKGLTLSTHVGEDVPPVVIADSVRISQVLNNLVSNGIKFTDKGEVAVTVSLSEQSATAAKLRFSVKDTGIGIPEHLHDTVFESFRQVQQSNTQQHKGTGLGLAITQRLVALHDSEILLKSIPGEGAEFYFDVELMLPEGDDNDKQNVKKVDVSAYKDKFSRVNFLLVEDNPVNIMVARKQLEHFGIKPDCAQNGREALELMKDKEYHIALVDLHMPEMDGFELSACIRKDAPGVDIVIFTADIMDDAREKVAQLGIRNIISKPFVPAEMLNILLHVVNERNI